MRALFYKLLAKLLGKNLLSTPKEVILDQLTEARPLPMGRKEFEEWAERQIAGALVPGGEEDQETFVLSQKYALANMLLHLGPTESHKPDAHFIHCLRKYAVNQTAHTIAQELNKVVKEKLAAQEVKEKPVEVC